MQSKQILATNEKYDIADHGIREAVFSGNMQDINLILENIVYFPKYVVSLDEFDMSRNGIKHRNIRDFLLAEEWN